MNNNPWQVLGGSNFRFFEIGVISVGPIFDIDIVCNGLEVGKSEAASILNEKLKTGDVVVIVPHKNKSDTIGKPSLNPISVLKEAEVDGDVLKNPRSLKINIDGQQDFFIKAINNTTICFNCIWLAKDRECKLTLGNTNYEDIEQWLQMKIDFGQIIQIVIE
ncbi:MAG: hypothetical protein GY781_21570 [Gammaproteobacteria bacterium]|nr:hypothetical protein [Gammaproteobacteria bacterium]